MEELLGNITTRIHGIKTLEAKLGDECSAKIRQVINDLEAVRLPAMSISLNSYVDELGHSIDYNVNWTGKFFETGWDSVEDFSPILGQSIEDRHFFAKRLPIILQKISEELERTEAALEGKLADISDESEPYDGTDEEMSEEQKDFMMTDGVMA